MVVDPLGLEMRYSLASSDLQVTLLRCSSLTRARFDVGPFGLGVGFSFLITICYSGEPVILDVVFHSVLSCISAMIS